MIIANRLLQEVEFLKQGYFTSEEMDTIVSMLNIAGGLDLGIEKCKGARLGGGNIDGLPKGSRQDWIAGGALMSGLRKLIEVSKQDTIQGMLSTKGETPGSSSNQARMRGRTKTLEALEALGVKLYGIEDSNCVQEGKCVSWYNIAGYYDL